MINVIALGNRLRGDDGIGPAVLDALQKQTLDLPFNFVDAGADAFTLLEYLNGENPNIVIDCADMRATPGTIKCFQLNEKTFSSVNGMISLHGFSFAEVYAMAKAIGPLAKTSIIGVQPQNIEFGRELSPEVQQAIPQILDLILREAKKYA